MLEFCWKETAVNSPYKYRLEKIAEGKNVVIHRADADDLEGEFLRVDEGGCTVKQESSNSETQLEVFVAYEHIRGVSVEEWDYDVIGH